MSRLLSYVDALREAVEQEMQRDPSVLLFGLDVEDHKAIQGSTRGLREKFGPERVFHSPLSEDAMTGIAIGAAMAGLRPVYVHIRMDFLMLCMNQLVNVAAKAHYMYGGQVRVPMVVRCMIGKSWGQGAQHSQGLYSMLMHVPGLKVVAPSNAHDAKGCTISAIRDDDPVVIVEHRLLYGTRSYVDEAPYEVPFGKSRICAEGSDITLVGISNMAVECLRAHELLKQAGIHAEVIDPIWLMPLDIETICRSVEKTGRLLVVDNGWTVCGGGAEIVAAIAERLGPDRAPAVARMGYAYATCPTSPGLEQLYYPNPATIAERAHALVRPSAAAWRPDAEHAVLAYQAEFRGPF
jgi:pyruvate dehydrogenase E1 component beta subunit